MKTQNIRKFVKILLLLVCLFTAFGAGMFGQGMKITKQHENNKCMSAPSNLSRGRNPSRSGKTRTMRCCRTFAREQTHKTTGEQNMGRVGLGSAETEPSAPRGRLAIVIDDFGMDRRGVEEMLSVPAPLTIAVLPGLDFSTEDAERAHALGHEVILHMPMENQTQMPAEYYGPKVVKNTMTREEAVSLVKDCLKNTPHAVGMNIHMGTGVSRNPELISAIMEEMKRGDKYFLDSKTIEDSVCPACAEATGVWFFTRDVFLEPSGHPSENVAYNYLMEAGNLALTNGKAIAIGHVGPVGEEGTARAIKKALNAFKNMGVEVVPLSEL